MTATLSAKLARAADTSQFGYAFLDLSGNGSGPWVPVKASVDSLGNLINPASSADIAGLVTAMGSEGANYPFAVGRSGLRGLVSTLIDKLGGTLSVQQFVGGQALSPTNRMPVEIDAANATLNVALPGVAQDSSLGIANTALASIAGYAKSLAGAVGNSALVVALKSNVSRVKASGALSAANTGSPGLAATSAVLLAVDGYSTAIVQITGVWAGTIAWYASYDDGASFIPVNMRPRGTQGGTSTPSATASGIFEWNPTGASHLQAVMTAYTSGTANVLIAAAGGGKLIRVEAPASDPLPTTDINNAAFTTSTALTAGTTYAPGRSVGVSATVAGSITLTLAGGGSIALPVGVGWQTFPFAATAYAFSGGAAGTVSNLS